jgi:hypothetical protein
LGVLLLKHDEKIVSPELITCQKAERKSRSTCFLPWGVANSCRAFFARIFRRVTPLRYKAEVQGRKEQKAGMETGTGLDGMDIE